jgi:hypothetical protein
MTESESITGGCFCGETRFVIADRASYACFCHCESCQRAAGAPVVAWATFGKEHFRVSAGRIHFRESSPGVTRGHCATCGTGISYANEKRHGEIDISLNAFDDPSAIAPRAHIWTEDKQPWLVINDDLPRYEKTVTSD